MTRQPVRLASYVLVGLGALLFILNAVMGGRLNIALPLVFFLLAGMFFLLVYYITPRWRFAALLYAPGGLMAALGVIFLLNVLTGDWGAWAYAWMLPLAGAGAGLLLAEKGVPPACGS